MALTSVEREPGQLRSASTGLRFLLLLFLAIALMVLDHRNQHLVEVRKDLAELLHPLQLLVSAPADISRNVSENIASRSKLLDENHRMKQDTLILNARMQRMAALEAENARLRALLDSTKKVSDEMLIAEILSVDLNPFRNMILINRGSNDGAYLEQAVIDADGVIGQIVRDRGVSSEVMLITDIDHAIPVEVVRNRLRTIALGTGELNRLSVPYLPVSADIREGDLLITSGLGGKFPPGYPVGTVRKVSRVTGLPFLEIDAEPASSLNRIREVLLITGAKRKTASAPKVSATPATEVTAAPDGEQPTDTSANTGAPAATPATEATAAPSGEQPADTPTNTGAATTAASASQADTSNPAPAAAETRGGNTAAPGDGPRTAAGDGTAQPELSPGAAIETGDETPDNNIAPASLPDGDTE